MSYCKACYRPLTTKSHLCLSCDDPAHPGAVKVTAPLDRAEPSPLHPIAAALMRDDGGEAPVFCVMAAYRSEDEARSAFVRIGGQP